MPAKRKAPKGCYWRGDTLWCRFVVQGVEIRRSLDTSDVRVAAARSAKLREDEIATRKFGDKRVTWLEAQDAWTSFIVGHTKQSTADRYLSSLTQIVPMLKDLYVDQIDKQLVATIVGKRQASGVGKEAKKRVTNATIRRDLTALSSVLDFAEDQGWRSGNPALDRLKKMKERRDPIVLPEPAHIEAVIARAPGNFGALIRAAWLTGCRLDELRGLTRDCVDLSLGQIKLYKTKNGKPRVIAMGDARSIIEALPKAKTSDAVFWHGTDSAAATETQRSRTNRPTRAAPYLNVSSNFRRLVAAAQKAAQQDADRRGVPTAFRPFRFHDLRHRFAVDWLKAGRKLYDLKAHLGHSSVQVTEIYLAHLTPEEADRVK